jgi:hypothetical protein
MNQEIRVETNKLASLPFDLRMAPELHLSTWLGHHPVHPWNFLKFAPWPGTKNNMRMAT